MEHLRVAANGIDLHVAADGAGPPVVLVHGFPELWFSWRHQMPALAQAGFRGLAPDMRGYGGSSRPAAVEAYDVVTIAGDMLGLLDALGEERAVFVGHDWGAMVAWHLALAHPQHVAGVVALSVPFVAPERTPSLAALRAHFGDDFYIAWFQEPGVADAALARDVRRTLTARQVWNADWAARTDAHAPYPWMAEEELAVYVAAFTETGFTGGLSWYRNWDRNLELTAPLTGRRVAPPALFLRGDRDQIEPFLPAAAMDGRVTDLRASVMLPGGHWIQQQRPREVNAALLRFLHDIGWER